MSLRRQLPVSSPIDGRSLVRALGNASTFAIARPHERAAAHSAVASMLASTFGASQVTLTDSGTSALVVALRLAVPPGGTVAFPGYACIDLAAAARFAGVRVRLYDLDPVTMSADLTSLKAALARGAQAVLAVHLYGYAADLPAMRAVSREHGAVLIEDAAQGAGGIMQGRPLGSFGDLSILSFGRGKGTTGGNGGALLSFTPEWDERARRVSGTMRPPSAGWGDLAAAAAQWAVGRPSLYALPSSVPGLRLGEMVFHPAHEPGSLSVVAATLVRQALAMNDDEVAARRRNATALADAILWDGSLVPIRPVPGCTPGFLRLPIRDRAGRGARAALGVMRGYPRTLLEQPELRPCLMTSEPATPGALDLRESLMTLPTHSMMTTADIRAVCTWLREAAPRTTLAAVLDGTA